MAAEVEIALMADMIFYCERDDHYIGEAARAYQSPPPGRSKKWLRTHCWACGRTRQEIASDQLSNL